MNGIDLGMALRALRALDFLPYRYTRNEKWFKSQNHCLLFDKDLERKLSKTSLSVDFSDPKSCSPPA